MSKVSRSATVELQLAIFPSVKICLYGKMQKLAACKISLSGEY